MARLDENDPNQETITVGERTDQTSGYGAPETDIEYSRRMAAYWKEQIKACDEQTNVWHKRATGILRRFRDERDKASEEGMRRANVLWTWYEIMKPAVFGRMPQAIVERRFLDHDPVGKMSSQILERSLRNEIEINGIEQAIDKAVQDYLLVGRGIVWIRHEPEFGPSDSLPTTSFNDLSDSKGPIEPPDESEETEKLEDTGEQLVSESAPVDYIFFKDFRFYPARARTWAEVQAVSKDVQLSKEECIEAFGDEIGSKIQADVTMSSQDRNVNINTSIFQDQQDRKRTITEIWNKSDHKVYWVSEGFDMLCKEQDDPLHLEGFFPCPEPLSAVTTNDTFIPVPYYHEWQDQAVQIDDLSQSIHMLNKAIRAAGVYKADAHSLRRLLEENTENELIPQANWPSLAGPDGKGLESCIYWLPIEQSIKALEVKVKMLELQRQVMDQVTGISDVLRGTSDARETMGAQRLKANAAGTRLEDHRKQVARFARDVTRLVAEVIKKHFSAKTLIKSSGILYEEDIQLNNGMPQPPQAPPIGQPQMPPMPQRPQVGPPAMPLGAPQVPPQSPFGPH